MSITCSKCGRTLKDTDFFKMKTGDRCDMCKDCLTQYIDNRNPNTFMWILEKFDVPYIEKKWVKLTNDRYRKNPASFGPRSVLGLYLRSMNMNQYREFGFKDSDKIAENRQESQRQQAKADIDPEYEAELSRKLEAGELSQAEYNTLTKTNVPESENPLVDEKGFLIENTYGERDLFLEQAQELTSQNQTPQYQIDSTYWTDQLNDDDINYLMLKWGTVYTPQEWITMEQMYNKYSTEYELNVDREEVLKKMCKTSLKMDEALDAGSVTEYKNLATVFDQLRKSGKFTEAQNKEDRQQVLSSIGELVALCEQEGGIIKNLPQFDPEQYPQDKIDFTLKDLKAYTYGLVSNELGLGDLIESYIEKLEQSEDSAVDLNAGLITSAEEAADEELTDEEAEDWQFFLESEIETEAELIGQLLGDRL